MKSIFNRFKKGFAAAGTTAPPPSAPLPETRPFMPATPALREAITGFIIQCLQPYVDEKGLAVAGLHFYMICPTAEQQAAAEAALCTDRPGMFRKEQLERKLLNHFIQLDTDWYFEINLIREEQMPAHCIRKGSFGLHTVRPGEKIQHHYSKAAIEILAGQAAQTAYELDPAQQTKFYIGRTSTPQLPSGKIQQNDIVFLGQEEPGFNEITGSPNGRVSRNHAYIVYDSKTGCWLLYPDKGGLPESGNKLKVHTKEDKVKWLNIYGVSHRLTNGDQVELGGSAVFRFRELEA